jgi:hypothetical protein
MKTTFCILASIPLMALSALPDLTLYSSTRNGAMVNVRLHVVDVDGHPVPRARLRGGMQTGGGLNDFTPIEGITNTNGDYVVTGKCTHRLRCGISKSGYYPSEFSLVYPIKDVAPQVIDGKWQPFGETRTVVLKEIRSPGELLVFPDSLRSCRIPIFNQWIGFDLESCDWLAPFGKGVNEDVQLRFEAKRNGLHDYRYLMDVSFTNHPYAGAYRMKCDSYSDLTTMYAADSNATFQTTFSFVSEQSPGKPRHLDFLETGSYLVFRTRTRIDRNGNLVGAHYGTILGRWLSDTEFMILSDGCFNPVENNTNIEDGSGLRDVLRNLRK